MNRFKLTITLFLFTQILSAKETHYRPMPYFPKSLVPYNAVDVVSYSLIPQIHSTLFSLNRNNQPIPELVKNFKVSFDGKTYTMKLNERFFHSGKKLNNIDIKNTLENAIKNQIIDYKKLFVIKGAEDYYNGKSKDISGIIIDNELKTIEFTLTKADPHFLYLLADPRLSIINTKNSHDGLGIYKISKIYKNEILLTFAGLNNDTKKVPRDIIYQEHSRKIAIDLFNKKKMDDLALYSLHTKDIKKLLKTGVINSFHYPRTYAVFLNSRLLNSSIRKEITQSINWEDLLKNCSLASNQSTSIIPPGFLGYTQGQKPIYKKSYCNGSKKKKIKFIIPKGLGGEKCLREYLAKKCDRYDYLIEGFGKVIDGWSKNTLEAYFGYVEAENSLDFYGHFTSGASFPLGIKVDKKLDELVSNLNKTRNILDRKKIAVSIGSHLNSLNTIIPLYYEKQYLIVSDKYKKMEIGIKSASMVPISSYEYRE